MWPFIAGTSLWQLGRTNACTWSVCQPLAGDHISVLWLGPPFLQAWHVLLVRKLLKRHNLGTSLHISLGTHSVICLMLGQIVAPIIKEAQLKLASNSSTVHILLTNILSDPSWKKIPIRKSSKNIRLHNFLDIDFFYFQSWFFYKPLSFLFVIVFLL